MNSVKTGLLLINVGTPESPSSEDVRNYLAEFLMDPEVIDLPWLLRFGLVHGVILRDRPALSAAQYANVWTDKGSPLMSHTVELLEQVRSRLPRHWVAEMAMRYGRPSIDSAIANLAAQNVDRIIAFPLYPQYSTAATRSAISKVEACVANLRKPIPLASVGAFYSSEHYLNAVTDISRGYLKDKKFDLVLFSFHGLPERQVAKTDLSGTHCFGTERCCEAIVASNVNCYRAQCFHTARELAKRLGLGEKEYQVCFQSRLGRSPWIRPYTDAFYRELPSIGVKRIAVMAPSFVSDCLETVEEVSIRGKEEFLRHGGEELFLVPSLNAAPEWAEALLLIANKYNL